MATGTVRWFNAEKGFGFISPDDGSADVFVRYSAIITGGYRLLEENQRVQFLIVQGQKGPRPRMSNPSSPLISSSRRALLPMGGHSNTAETMRALLEHAVEDLATGPGTIQQRLAATYLFCHLVAEENMHPGIFPDIHALQVDLRAALSTVHDSERGSAAASAAQLTDDQCIVFARRILDAARSLRTSG